MNIRNFGLALAALAGFLMGTAQAQAIDGLKTNARVFDDFSTTNLVINNSNSVNQGPGVSFVTIDETDWEDDGIGGSFANRHDITFSSDGGASDHVFNIGDSYTVKALVTLDAGSNAPRKEAGFRINSPVTGDMLFLVNSDAGEIVAFGGGAPFHIFGSNAGGNGYTPGTEILMGFTLLGANVGVSPNTIEYFIDRGAGIESSGPLAWANIEGGPVNYQLAMYSQASPDLQNPQEFVSTSFDDIMFMVIPEPTTIMMAVVGLLSLACAGRRRRG